MLRAILHVDHVQENLANVLLANHVVRKPHNSRMGLAREREVIRIRTYALCAFRELCIC